MDNHLKDRADNFELPLKPGAWEEIVPHIPEYQISKRRLLYLILPHTIGFISGLCFVFILSLFLPSSNQNLTNKNGISDVIELKPSANLTNNQKSTSTENDVNIPPQISRKSQLSETKSIDKSTRVSSYNTKEKSEKYIPTKLSNSNDVNSIVNLNSLGITNSNDYSNFGIDIETYFKINGFRFFVSKVINNEKAINYAVVPLFKDTFKRKSKYETNIFASVSLFNNRLIVVPELMKLPNGKGHEYTLGINKRKKKFSVFSSFIYTSFKQSTSMGNVFDSTYYQAFKPNFKTMMPQEYASRVHDTASLYIAGTNHNTVNQQFQMIGLSLGSAYRILNYKKFSVETNYAFTYRLLRKANTFFYDSINRVAVPFTQTDKGIVFRNLLSSRVGLALHYQMNSVIGLQIGGFYDYYHSAFVKHYYKAKIRNYGLQLGLTFKLND